MSLLLFEVDGEDLIVASSERDARKIYRDYHEETIRGHELRQVPQDEDVTVTDGDGQWDQPARTFCYSRGYFAAYR